MKQSQPYRKTALILFTLCFLSVVLMASFWKLASDAAWRSNIDLNGGSFVPEGMSSFSYAMQQTALEERYLIAFIAAGTVALITLSSGVTYIIVERHQSRLNHTKG